MIYLQLGIGISLFVQFGVWYGNGPTAVTTYNMAASGGLKRNIWPLALKKKPTKRTFFGKAWLVLATATK